MSTSKFHGPKTAKPIVLALDDEPDNLKMMERTYRTCFHFISATSGREALSLMKSLERVNVLLVDQRMPEMKGHEFLEQVNQEFDPNNAIVKILITAYTDSDDIIQAINQGRIDYFYQKPVDLDELKQKIRYLLAIKSHEQREVMRVELKGPHEVTVRQEFLKEGQITNLSQRGMFLETLSFFPKDSVLPFELTLPSGRRLTIDGRIVRTDPERHGFGIEFVSLDEPTQVELVDFLTNHVTLTDLKQLKKRYPFLRTNEMVALTDQMAINDLIEAVLKKALPVLALHSNSQRTSSLNLTTKTHGKLLVFSGKGLDLEFKTSEAIFLSFYLDYTTYSFETRVSRIVDAGSSLECLYPRVLFYSEKRSVERSAPPKDMHVEILLPEPLKGTLTGKVIDLTARGVSFLSDPSSCVLLPGTPLTKLRILENNQVIREDHGEVRNLFPISPEENAYRYGIQFGIGRRIVQVSEAPGFRLPQISSSLQASATTPAPSDHRVPINLGRHPPRVVRFENDKGEELVGLLNLSQDKFDTKIPVVVIPPAFGKTKETLYALALTLVTNFQMRNQPLAVLRYDGIRKKGESHKDPDSQNPPYEMLHASFTQGALDILACLDWVRANPIFESNSVVLLSFSLSALEARLVLRNQAHRHRIDYWISCMGTPELRHILTTANCGLDLLEQHQLGISMGVIPVLGNLVAINDYVGDAARNHLTSIDQARKDMQQIDLPVTWIFGEHDHWVEKDFIRDVMGVDAKAPREVISLPLGHNARSSEEAMRLFATVTSLVYRFVHDERIEASIPQRDDLEYMRKAEKDRLATRITATREEYWKRYLIGEENRIGFDVATLSDDYQELMQDQIKLLELEPTHSLLDLGGGTGNFIQALLQSEGVLPKKITLADLIPEAIARAEKKTRKQIADKNLPLEFETRLLDIELNRYLPIQRFLKGEYHSLDCLANVVENLPVQSLAIIGQRYSQSLHDILRGKDITQDRERQLKKTFELEELRVLYDLHWAAKVVQGDIPRYSDYRILRFPPDQSKAMQIDLASNSYDRIVMSLVLSYVFNPKETLLDLRRILKPGGRLVLSTLYPDADASGFFTKLVAKVEGLVEEALPHGWKKSHVLESIRSFLNDAQALVELEEEGIFEFFTPERLEELLLEAGFSLTETKPSFGYPPQAFVCVCQKEDEHA